MVGLSRSHNKDSICLILQFPSFSPTTSLLLIPPRTSIEIPDLLPGIDILPDRMEIPRTENKLPELGHAGVLFINGSIGTTKYYEYGRYGGSLGAVRKRTIRNVSISNGHPTKASLSYTLSQISAKSGQNGKIMGAYIEVPNQYQAMLNYASKRYGENRNPNRRPYDLLKNNCNHFMQGVLEAAGVDVPYMLDPRPNSYIEEIRDKFPDLDYSKANNSLVVENPPRSLAFNYALPQPAAA